MSDSNEKIIGAIVTLMNECKRCLFNGSCDDCKIYEQCGHCLQTEEGVSVGEL